MKKYLVLLAVVSALVLAGCGGSDDGGAVSAGSSSTSGAGSDHNASDVTFAQGMIPHHQQAIEMADLALKNSDSAEVKDLANRIRTAQQPEIDTLTKWLTGWGESADGGMSGMSGMDHNSGSGMMDDAGMKDLEQASGAEFDSMFLTAMIEHHTGAVSMAKTELADGADDGAKDMAQNIVDSQTKEISEMKGLLSASSK